MQAQFPLHTSPHIGQPIAGVLDQGPAFDPQAQCAPIGLAGAALVRLQPMQLAAMPLQRRETQQAHVIRLALSTNLRLGQDPGVDTVRVPCLSQFLAAFLETKRLAQLLRLPSLFGLDRGKLCEFRVKPVLAHFEWRKTLIPPLLPTCRRFNILDDIDRHRKKRTEPAGQPQFPLPPGFCRWWQLLGVAQAMGTGLAARRLAIPPSPAHPAALRDGILDPMWGIGLHIEIGMGSRNHTVALFFTPRINPNCDRLQVACRGLDIETDAENTPFPERSSFATFNPASGPGWSSRHQRLLVAIDDGYKHGGKPLYIHSLRC